MFIDKEIQRKCYTVATKYEWAGLQEDGIEDNFKLNKYPSYSLCGRVYKHKL